MRARGPCRRRQGDDVVVDVTGLASDEFGAGDAFIFGFVGEHRAVDDVADGVDAGDASAVVGVGFDAFAVVEFDADGVEAEVVGVGAATDGDEDDIGGVRTAFVCAFPFEGDGRVCRLLLSCR